MKKSLLLLASILSLLTSCTDEDGARKALEGAGYTDIEMTGYRAWMAGKEDSFSTGFRAKGPTGKEVSGAVTRGALKGSTIRLD